MKRVLITGGAGFIGSAVIRYLIKEKKINVVNIDCLTYSGNLLSLEEHNYIREMKPFNWRNWIIKPTSKTLWIIQNNNKNPQ